MGRWAVPHLSVRITNLVQQMLFFIESLFSQNQLLQLRILIVDTVNTFTHEELHYNGRATLLIYSNNTIGNETQMLEKYSDL